MSSQLAVCEHYGFEATNTVRIGLAIKGQSGTNTLETDYIIELTLVKK